MICILTGLHKQLPSRKHSKEKKIAGCIHLHSMTRGTLGLDDRQSRRVQRWQNYERRGENRACIKPAPFSPFIALIISDFRPHFSLFLPPLLPPFPSLCPSPCPRTLAAVSSLHLSHFCPLSSLPVALKQQLAPVFHSSPLLHTLFSSIRLCNLFVRERYLLFLVTTFHIHFFSLSRFLHFISNWVAISGLPLRKRKKQKKITRKGDTHRASSMFGLTRSGRIILLLGLNIIMFLAELIVGYKTGSLALIADAFHMLSDVLSQVIALYAIRVSLFSYLSKWSHYAIYFLTLPNDSCWGT